jgi:hypothetical protein
MESPKKQIRNLLIVLASGVLGAAALVGFMLYSYGPSGSYQISHVLLKPELIFKLSFSGIDPRSNRNAHFLFDRLEFSSYNESTRTIKKWTITPEAYAKFYALVANEKSLATVDESLLNRFNHPARLILYVKTENSSAKPFQEIDFENGGDYFRVELHEASAQTRWAYFYSPSITRHVLQLFTEGSSP